MKKRSMQQLNRNDDAMSREQRERGLREMTTAELEGVVGAAPPTLAPRAFNPQPDPPKEIQTMSSIPR